jgi:hypothetical protein
MRRRPHSKNPPHHIPTHLLSPGSEKQTQLKEWKSLSYYGHSCHLCWYLLITYPLWKPTEVIPLNNQRNVGIYIFVVFILVNVKTIIWWDMPSRSGTYELMFWRNLHRFPEHGSSSPFKTMVPIYQATRRHILGENNPNVRVCMDLRLKLMLMGSFLFTTVCRAQPDPV